MRLLGTILALAAIAWLLYSAGGGNEESVIPQSYQQSLEKAQGVEKVVNDAAREQLDAIDRN